MIIGIVKEQNLKLNARAVANTIDYLTAKFTFLTSDWDGLTIYAHFQNGDDEFTVELNEAGAITESDHLNLSAGEWSVFLHGNEYEGGNVVKRITTNIAKFTVEPTGIPFSEVEPSIVEEINAKVADHEARIETLEEGSAGNYEALLNKPSINNVELIGDISLEEIGAVEQEDGKGLSSNDYTDTDKAKVDGAYSKAEVDALVANKITKPATAQSGNVLTYNGTDWVAGASSGGGSAADIDYDNTDSGLIATNVQDAIDEIAQSGGGGSTADILLSGTFTQSGDIPSWTDYLNGTYTALTSVASMVTKMRSTGKVDISGALSKPHDNIPGVTIYCPLKYEYAYIAPAAVIESLGIPTDGTTDGLLIRCHTPEYDNYGNFKLSLIAYTDPNGNSVVFATDAL